MSVKDLAFFAIEHAALEVFWADSHGQIIDVNPAAVKAMGYSREELLLLHVADLNPDYPRESWPQLMAEMRQKSNMTIESRHLRKDGSLYDAEINIALLTNQDGQEMICGMVKDISERKQAERELKQEKEKSEEVLRQLTELSLHYQKELAVHRQTEKQLHHLAMYDPLTELPNRILLKSDAEKMVAIARRYDYKIGCIAVSIDDLDKILTSYDQNTADAVVVEMSLNLAETVRDCDTLGRPDCNRFVVYVSNCQSSEEINLIAHRVMRSATRPLESIQQEIPKVSLGVAVYPDDSQSVSTLLSLAETAKNIAFRDGKHLHFHKLNQAMFLPADDDSELKSS